MNGFIKIGEMADLFGLNIRTLRYYDKIGILKPVYINPDTHYRYYSIEQFQKLNTIRYLRTQGLSLEVIDSMLKDRNPHKIQSILKEQFRNVNKQIIELEHRKIRLQNRIKEIDNITDKSLMNVIRICELPPRPVVSINLKSLNSKNIEMHMRSLELESRIEPSYFFGKVGLSVSVDDIRTSDFKNYKSLFCLVDAGETKEPTKEKLPSGIWVKLRFYGKYTDSSVHYKRLMQYLDEHKLKPTGDALEFSLMDEGLTDNPQEYTTEIQIPVDDKN